MAAMRLGGEKPHQGLPSENPALNLGHEVCNCTVLLGMRGQAELNRAGSCCTGKERDSESGNDYFGARYYSSAMGRFMSPDPMLNSARPGNPQTWNRYAYVRNNPLGRIDPTGLYDMKNTCGSGDKACNAAFAATTANVRSMYASTVAARDKALASGDKKAAAALQRTLDGLGPEGQKNARGQTVNVSVNLGLATPGQTTMGKNGTVNVELNPGMSDGDNGVQASASHEGVHAGEIMPGLPTHGQALSTERDAYETESYFSQAIGFENIHSPSNGSDMVNGVLDMSKDFVIWNPSWAAADVETNRSRGVEAAAQDGANSDCANGGCKP
jgi:RHS repeat-associated protein